jgi:hypothetical protein
MPGKFSIVDLAPADVPRALPLLRATWPELDLVAWQTFAGAFCSEGAAQAQIASCDDSSGGLCGLFASRIEVGLCEGRLLAIPLFTAIDIGNSLEPLRALLAATETRAATHACGGMQIRLSMEQSGLSKRLRSLGLQCYRRCAEISMWAGRRFGQEA